jgi:hypothetical protein
MSKQFILILSFLLISFVGIKAQNFQPQSNGSAVGPQATWKKTSHDFKQIPQNVPVSTTFEIKNTGKAPLIISEVKPSCGCTTPTYTQEPIMPGKTGTIKAQYNAADAGKFNKAITVITNSTEQPRITLYITGEVIE